MSVNRSSPFLFNISDDVASCVEYSPREAVIEPGIRCTTDAFITNVMWCKEKAFPFHEFLVFHVKEKSPGHEVSCVLVERRVNSNKISKGALGDDVDIEPASYLDPAKGEVDFASFDAADDETALDTPPTLPAGSAPAVSSPSSTGKTGHIGKALTLLSTTSKLVSSVSSMLHKSKELEDRLVFTRYKFGSDAFVMKLRNDHETMYLLRLEREQFSVFSLAVLADVVHRARPSCSALAFQCHWFAEAIYFAVKRGWGKVETPGAHYFRCGKFGLLPIPAPHNKKIFDQVLLERFYVAWEEQRRIIEEEKERMEKEKDEITRVITRLEKEMEARN